MIQRVLLAGAAGLLLLFGALLFLVLKAVVAAPPQPRPGGTYTEGVIGPVSVSNPLFASLDQNTHDIDTLLYQPLVRLLPNGKGQGVLASTWEISPDQRSYLFTLRGNARWSDGSPLTADDVVFTVRTVQDSHFPTSVLSASWKDVIATSVDSAHVRFTLPGRNAGFMATLELLDIVPEHLLSGKSISDMASGASTGDPVGTGPFRVSRKLPDRIVLERNPFAWDKPWIETFQLQAFPTLQAALDALDRGAIDGVANLNQAAVKRESRDPQVVVESAATYQYTELLFNLKPDVPYFQDKAVRRAIAMSIDKQAIVKDILGGGAVQEDGPIPHAISWAVDPAAKPASYDPEGARQLLNDAGWTVQDGIRTHGGTPLRFDLAVADDVGPYLAVARKIASDLAAQNITVDIREMPTATLIHDYLNPRTFQSALLALDNGPDPDVFSFWHSSQAHTGGFNFAFPQSKQQAKFLDRYLEDGRAAVDLPTRAKAYANFQEVFAEQAEAVDLYSPTFNFAVNRRIHGVKLDSAVEPADRFAYAADWYIEVGH